MMPHLSCLRFVLLLGGLLLGVSALAAERAPRSEYEVLRSFPPGRLAILSAGDKPDANGFTGGNRGNGFWIEVGPQRGSCRGVVAAVALGDLAAADDCWRGIDTAFAHQRADALVNEGCAALRAAGLLSTELDALARFVVERES